MKKHIPNTLTLCNLVSGCVATYFAFSTMYEWAFAFIIIGAVFDFFDGFVARLLHVSSDIGKELDSLADDITFGFAPAAIVFSLLRASMAGLLIPGDYAAVAEYVPFVAFLIAAFSGLRLAKFNLDERQTDSFVGLPTPANALFWSSVAVALQRNHLLSDCPWISLVLLAGVFLSSWLLVAEIPMFALKFHTYGLRGNEVRYAFVLFSLIILSILGFVGFSAVILLYVMMSIVINLLGTNIAEEE